MMNLFGKNKKEDPKELVNKWSKTIRKEGYGLDRQIRQIQREENKVTQSLKESAKKGDKDVCKILAKEILHSRKAVSKIYAAKANLNSVEMQMKNQSAQIRLCGALSRSTEVMNSMQKLIQLPEINAIMIQMSREMMKAGILEEMIDDTITLEDDEELEDDVQLQIDRILDELLKDTNERIGQAPQVPEASIGVKPERVEESDDEELEEMKERLQALRS